MFLQELEEKRKQKSQVVYERKKQLTKLRIKAEKAAEEKLGSQLEILAPVKELGRVLVLIRIVHRFLVNLGSKSVGSISKLAETG
ncbi:hypothetical protein RHGRI_014644 [Rhododendron griersonianum]|uniref:Uncharacterized protein n=1 Tax=Rhododendron griersonianum TaxID=479676 RepID=A0AAV6KAL7_9ERIC|nr:hypothetical protein RHGRI_014644 [Rhododendron griersonianum]